MSGAYGNDNLYFTRGSQFLTVDETSDTVTLKPSTRAVSLVATAAMWVRIGTPGETPTAAAPGAEKTFVENLVYLPGEGAIDRPVPQGSEAAPIKIAAIQATAAGVLYVEERSSI